MAEGAQSSVQRFWAGLPTAGKIAVVAVSLVVLIGILINVNSRDEASYAAGLEDGQTNGRLMATLGGSSVTDAQLESSCDTRTSVAANEGTYWSKGRIERGDLDRDDFREGCIAGSRDAIGR